MYNLKRKIFDPDALRRLRAIPKPTARDREPFRVRRYPDSQSEYRSPGPMHYTSWRSLAGRFGSAAVKAVPRKASDQFVQLRSPGQFETTKTAETMHQ